MPVVYVILLAVPGYVLLGIDVVALFNWYVAKEVVDVGVVNNWSVSVVHAIPKADNRLCPNIL